MRGSGLTESCVMRGSTFHLAQKRRLVGVLSDLRRGAGEVEVTAGVSAADSAGGHHRSAAVIRVAHAADGSRGGGRSLSAGGAARALPPCTLRTLLPRVEALAHSRVGERGRGLAG